MIYVEMKFFVTFNNDNKLNYVNRKYQKSFRMEKIMINDNHEPHFDQHRFGV